MKIIQRQRTVLITLTAVLSILLVFTNITYKTSPGHIIHIRSSSAEKYYNTCDGPELCVEDKMTEHFNSSGIIISGNKEEQLLHSNLKVSLIHSYSPYTENRFRAMLIDPTRQEHHIYANSPAILRTESGDVLTVMRIWLEKEKWIMTSTQSHNKFQDNYFYIQKFDGKMQPVSPGAVLGIPTPLQWTVGDGPIEPRLFQVNDTIYVTFNTGIFTKNMKAIDSTFIWDLNDSKGIFPKIEGGQPMLNHSEGFPRDKHWSALVNDTKLYFIYNLDPLRVMDCRMQKQDAPCHFVHKEGPDDYKFKAARDALRGGTPFVLYKYPYYISVAHGTFYQTCPQANFTANNNKTRKKTCHTRHYTTFLVMMTIEPTFKIIYMSDCIPFPKKAFDIPIVRYKFIPDPFFFPVGLILESSDSLVVGGHINDHSSVLFRIRGYKQSLDSAIKYHISNPNKPGPEVGALHDQARVIAERMSGLKLANDNDRRDVSSVYS